VKAKEKFDEVFNSLIEESEPNYKNLMNAIETAGEEAKIIK
jgi:hypothetical protein